MLGREGETAHGHRRLESARPGETRPHRGWAAEGHHHVALIPPSTPDRRGLPFLVNVAWKFGLLMLLWPVFKLMYLFRPVVSSIHRREMGDASFFEYWQAALADPDRFIQPGAFYAFYGFLLVVVVLTEYSGSARDNSLRR